MNETGQVGSQDCFPKGMTPYANKMLVAMQSDPRFVGHTFSQMDLLNWFGEANRGWCSEQEMLDKLPAALKQKLAECNKLPDNMEAPSGENLIMGRAYCMSELESEIIQWMLSLLASDMLGIDPSSLISKQPPTTLPGGSQKSPPIRLPGGGLRLPNNGFEQTPDGPPLGGGDDPHGCNNGSTGYHWCDSQNECLPPDKLCPKATENTPSKATIMLGVFAGIAVLGTAAYWYATRSKGVSPEQNPTRRKLRSEIESDEVEQEVRELAESRFEGAVVSPAYDHGQWFVLVSPDPEDPSDENSEATYSVVDASDGLDLERL